MNQAKNNFVTQYRVSMQSREFNVALTADTESKRKWNVLSSYCRYSLIAVTLHLLAATIFCIHVSLSKLLTHRLVRPEII